MNSTIARTTIGALFLFGSVHETLANPACIGPSRFGCFSNFDFGGSWLIWLVLVTLGFFVCFIIQRAFRNTNAPPKGRPRLIGLLTKTLVIFIVATLFTPIRVHHPQSAMYASEAIPLVGHLRTQVSLYQYDHGQLPFETNEIGTCTSFVPVGDNYKTHTFRLGDSDAETEDISLTTSFLTRIDVSISELRGRRMSPEQLHTVCMANGPEGYAYAIGVFGNGKEQSLPRGTGFAFMDVYFPNVIMDGTHSNTWYVPLPEQGYRLSGEWKQYHHGSSLYRFGTAGAKGVCPVFPPEMFSQMDSITQIQGDSPNCVEYWIEKLKAEPHGEYWDFPRHNKSDYGIAQ